MTAAKISYFVSSLFIEINYTHDGNAVNVFIWALTWSYKVCTPFNPENGKRFYHVQYLYG